MPQIKSPQKSVEIAESALAEYEQGKAAIASALAKMTRVGIRADRERAAWLRRVEKDMSVIGFEIRQMLDDFRQSAGSPDDTF